MRLLATAFVVIVLAHAQQAGQVGVARQPRSPLGVSEPLVVLNAERGWSTADAFWILLNDDGTPHQDRQQPRERNPDVRRYAVRAIGRVEDPAQVRRLLAVQDVPFTTRAEAVAQSLYGFDPANDSRLVAEVAHAFRAWAKGPAAATAEERMFATARLARAMSHVAYATAEQIADMESLLADAMAYATTSIHFKGPYMTAIVGLEALARINTKLVHYNDKTLEQLAKAAKGETIHGDDERGRLYAFMALVAAKALEPDIERKALKDNDWTVRRAAAAVLAGSGGGLDDEARLEEIRDALDDSNPHVRYEAVRGWGRFAARTNGCQPLLDALKDNDQHVALQAFDLLGALCLEDEEITKRLEAETAIPQGADWPRPTHAFVALAKRSPEKSAIHMEAFITHPVWWVRMYTAFATAGAKDLLRLDRLAYDDNDNVREAAIPHFRSLDPERAERAILAALERTDVQLIHTTAGLIKEAPHSPRWVPPMVASLDRLTRLRSMTSRDGRLALLDAIEHHAKAEDQTQLLRWLRDYDPVVASRAADVILHLSGKPAKAEPTPSAHIPTQPFPDLRQCVVVNMSPGKPFKMRMDPEAAPIAVEQFLKLATIDRYYNGLTIHRVVPNFVIQGGSPGANEYAGYKEYLRDEVAGSNVRGSVGLSIRGRNTGDAQFYVNLVDNPRLDGGYTVFAHVFDDDMETVDRVQEGDVMRSIDSIPCGEPVRRR
jgi:cyclophilin family peptidyl-prolyl cis-trans isomerase